MIKINVDRMAEILRVKSASAFEEALSQSTSTTYLYALNAALSAGDSQEEAEMKAFEEEQKEHDVEITSYINSICSVFEEEAEKIGLEVHQLKTQPWAYAITPKTNWTAAAQEVRTIVHGIGGWWFPTFKEFLTSGPYTPRQAVDAHLGYIGEQWKLYGYTSPERRVYRS